MSLTFKDELRAAYEKGPRVSEFDPITGSDLLAYFEAGAAFALTKAAEQCEEAWCRRKSVAHVTHEIKDLLATLRAPGKGEGT